MLQESSQYFQLAFQTLSPFAAPPAPPPPPAPPTPTATAATTTTVLTGTTAPVLHCGGWTTDLVVHLPSMH